MNKEGLKEKIVEEIIKSGYPLEYFCINTLLTIDWTVFSDKQYILPNGDYREIDIHATNQFSDRRMIKDVFSSLIIECKKNHNKPWVFFKDPHTPLRYLNFLTNIDSNNFSSSLKINFILGGDKHHFVSSHDVSSSYLVAFTKTNAKENRQIYEAITKVIECFKFNKKQKEQFIRRDKYFEIVYLVVVFDGQMFLAFINGNNVTLEERNHIIVPINYSEILQSHNYTIDVVKRVISMTSFK